MNAVQVLRLQTLEELLAAVPRLLGFPPHESLVSVVLRDQQLQVTARIGFPSPDLLPATIQVLARIWSRFENVNGFLIAYTERCDPMPVLQSCAAALSGHQLTTVAVTGGHWRELTRNGHYGDHPPPETLEQGWSSFKVSHSREELAQFVIPTDDVFAQSLVSKQRAKLERVAQEVWPNRMRLLLDGFDPLAGLPRASCIQAAILTEDGAVRDVALLACTQVTAKKLVEFWGTVVRHCPAEQSIQPLGLLGLAAWVSGDGALQMICLERATEILRLSTSDLLSGFHTGTPKVPRLLGILAWINLTVLPPSRWEEFRTQLIDDICA